jgi:hypothetical protein
MKKIFLLLMICLVFVFSCDKNPVKPNSYDDEITVKCYWSEKETRSGTFNIDIKTPEDSTKITCFIFYDPDITTFYLAKDSVFYTNEIKLSTHFESYNSDIPYYFLYLKIDSTIYIQNEIPY